MADECQYLEYRPLADDSGGGAGDGGTGDAGAGDTGPDGTEAGGAESGANGSDDGRSRAYCTAAGRFVQAMRADICNRRYGLDPETDCEIYRDREGLPEASAGAGANVDDAGGD